MADVRTLSSLRGAAGSTGGLRGVTRSAVRAAETSARHCARPQCGEAAVASMSYDYGARVVFVGGLSVTRHPALYDLCAAHADQLRVPNGWTVRVEPWAQGSTGRAGSPIGDTADTADRVDAGELAGAVAAR